MRQRLTIALVVALGAAACQPQPLAEEPVPVVALDGQAERGLALAQQSCAACHAVEPRHVSPHPEAPPFAQIANRANLTDETLASWLENAHNYPAAMQFELDRTHVEALSAYIVTLKDPDYEPPIQ